MNQSINVWIEDTVFYLRSKIEGGSEPHLQNFFLNSVKSCFLSCLSNVDNIKKIHGAGFE